MKAEIATLPRRRLRSSTRASSATEAARATAVAQVLGGRLAWDAVFRDLARVLPDNVWLSTLQLAQPTPRRTSPTRPRRAAPVPGGVPHRRCLDRRLHVHPARCRPPPGAARDAPLAAARDADVEPESAHRVEAGRPLCHRRRPELDRRCVMNDLLHSPKAKVGAAVAGGLLIVLAAWFLLVSPQRAKANELDRRGRAPRGRVRRTRQRALRPRRQP